MTGTTHDVGRDTAPETSPSLDRSDALVDAVRRAATDRTPVAIRGGNTKSWLGHRVDGEALDLRSHSGVVDYEPSELVLTARSGTPLKEIEALLARHRQMLAFEPPVFAADAAGAAAAAAMRANDDAMARAIRSAARGATLGGCVASGLSGPRRMAAGSVRDFVLGAKLIDGRARHLAFGGQVMKNVAGYDVSRVLAGSFGTLGVITEVSLKVLPMPAQSATLSFALDETSALDQLNRWAGQPLAITASAWTSRPSGDDPPTRGGRLLVRLEGSEAAVQSGIRRLGGLDLEPDRASAWWAGLREQTDGFFAARPPDAALWRLALPSTAPPLDRATLAFTDQLIEWGGAQRWIATRADPYAVREAAAQRGGHATLWRASDEQKRACGVFAPLSPPLMAIHRRLKTEFDPDGLFNRGRLYPSL